MKKHYLFYLLLLGLIGSAGAQTQTFPYTGGTQNYPVTASGTVSITARGGDGGDGGNNGGGKGGGGGTVSATFMVQAGDMLTVVVGGSGGIIGGGGGGSAVLATRSGIETILLVSGAGGGAISYANNSGEGGGGSFGGPGSYIGGSGGGANGNGANGTSGSGGGSGNGSGSGGSGGSGAGKGGYGFGGGGGAGNAAPFPNNSTTFTFGGGGGGYTGGPGGSTQTIAAGGSSYSQSTGDFAASSPISTYGTRGGGTNQNGSISITFTIGKPTLSQPTVTNVTCNGGSDGKISASATSGRPPYTFSLSPAAGTQTSYGTFTGLVAGTYTLTVTDANQKTDSKQVTVTEPTKVTFSTSSVMPKCFGGSDGSISVSPSGGTGPSYTYSIDGKPYVSSSTFAGLSAGTYSIKVKDANGCETTQAITVNQPTAVTFTTTSVMPKCNGGSDGSISVSASGGTPPYKYSKDGGVTYSNNNAARLAASSSVVPQGFTFTGLSAGTYSIQVKDANDCATAVQSVILSEPTALTFTTTSAMPKCNGGSDGSITITPSGGTPGYNYSKDGGTNYASSPSNLRSSFEETQSYTFTGLSAGTYSIKVRDANGCATAVQSVIVSEPAALSVTISGNTSVQIGYVANSNCTTLTASASGGTGTKTYQWIAGSTSTSPTINVCPTTTTTYTVRVTDTNGCTTEKSVTVNVEDVRCGSGGIKVCLGGREICLAQYLVPTYLRLGAKLGSCGGSRGRTSYEPQTSELPLVLTLKAYPNPVQDAVTLEVLAPRAGEATIEVLDMSGRARQSRKENLVEGVNEVGFKLGTLPTGIYLIRAVDALGQQATVRVSKQ